MIVLHLQNPGDCQCDQFIKTRYRYVLTDFGFSKLYCGEQFSSERSGSEGYRAPELTNPKTLGQYSDKTDIWAFGCLLMELASTKKRKAFLHDWGANMYANGSEDHPLPQLQKSDNPELDDGVLAFINGVIRRCFKVNPENRPSAEKLHDLVKCWANLRWRHMEV